MKKTLLVLFSLLIFGFANAQIYTGLNAKVGFPIDHDYDSHYEFGGEFLIGYSLNQKIDFDISCSKSWFPLSIIIDYQQMSIKGNCKYYLLEKTIRPYLGLGGGFFQESFSGLEDERITKNSYCLSPSIGILFDSKITKGLYINTEFTYTRIFSEGPFSQYSFNIGLKYYIVI